MIQGVNAAGDIDNMTPLYYSVKFSHESIVGLLLDNSMSIDAGVHRKPWSRKTDTSNQVLITASEPDISCTATGLEGHRHGLGAEARSVGRRLS